jgi:hypothetical protein
LKRQFAISFLALSQKQERRKVLELTTKG